MSSTKGLLVGALVSLAQVTMATDYTVAVAAGVTNTVDETFVAELGSADRLVKRGKGVLELNALMTNYKGEIVAEEGVLLAKVTGSLGTYNGATVVSNGASIVIKAASKDTCKFYSETFKIAGSGAEGEKGAFANIGASLTGQNIRYITLLDDATIYAWGELSLYAGKLDMNGKTLTLYVRNKDDSGSTSWDYSFSFARSRVVNPGHIVLQTGKLMITGKTLSDGTAVWDGDDTNTLTVKPVARLAISSSYTKVPWKLILENASGVHINGDVDAAANTNNAWGGSVELKGVDEIPFHYANGNKIMKGTANLLGNITGTGGFSITGYNPLHLWGEGSFAGTVSAVGNSNSYTPLTLHNGRALPAAGGGLRLVNANLPLVATNAYELPVVAISNVNERTISGAEAGGTMASLVKRGTGNLIYDTAVAVTGTMHLVAGTVTIPSVSPRMQSGGVMEGTVLLKDDKDATYWGKNSDSIGGPAVTDRQTATRYAYLGKQPLWASSYVGIRYSGYLWNTSETNEIWSFVSAVQRRAKLYVNGVNVFGNCTWKSQVSLTYAVFGHATLKPGANKIDYYMEVSTNGDGGANKPTQAINFNGASVAATDFSWVANKGLAYNRSGTDSLSESDYSKFDDLADGSLMTVTNDFSHLSYIAKSEIGDLVVDAGATLDLTGPEVTVAVRTFAGSGAVANGALRITEQLSLTASQLSAASPAIANAELLFADGAVVGVDSVSGLDRARTKDNPYVIVSGDTAFAAAPGVSAALAAKNWTTALSADSKSVLLYYAPKGMVLLVR